VSRLRRRPVALGSVLGLLAVAILSIAWLVLSGEGDQSSNHEPRQGALGKSSPTQVSAGWEDSYPVFESRAEGLPKPVGQLLRKAPYVLYQKRAQKLQVQAPAAIWAVPGKKHLCLVTQEIKAAIGSTCTAVARMRARPVATTFILPPALRPTGARRFIVGIAPRSAKEIMVLTDETRTRLPVVRGVFAHQDMLTEPPDRFTVIR
jgi:hypothetical protein